MVLEYYGGVVCFWDYVLFYCEEGLWDCIERDWEGGRVCKGYIYKVGLKFLGVGGLTGA